MGNRTRFYVDVMAQNPEVTGSTIPIPIKFPDGMSLMGLVDCGSFQEREYNSLNHCIPFDASNLDFVLVTHNHTDHTGRLPMLVKNGYRGPIYTTLSTSKLIDKALEDSYAITKNNTKRHHEPPLYSSDDVSGALAQIKAFPYEQAVNIYQDKNRSVRAYFFMNGHLPGAAVILLMIKYHDSSSDKHYEDINLLFTGDYNNKNMMFDVRSIPNWVKRLPLTIIQESTYGDMDSSEIEYVYEKNVLNAIKDGKDVISPVFSLGRSQEIMYILKNWQKEGKLDRSIPIYLDGKLAFRYTSVYLNDGLDNREECRDILPDNISYVSKSQRHSIITDGQQKIILTTSGMASYGPAQFYLPEYLKRPNALIHFTGYCTKESFGRRLYDCPVGSSVKIKEGFSVVRRADVQFTSEFSAHAKADELIDFLKQFTNIRMILINHGETETKNLFADRVSREIKTRNIGILGEYAYRIDGYGYVKSFTAKLN